MADHISARIISDPLVREMREIKRTVDQATVIALREVARLVSKEAKKAAPVYKGDDPRATPGEYKKSIRVSRILRQPKPHFYALTVGPRGQHPHQYAYKLEDQYEPMHKGEQAAEPQARAIHERAWDKAVHRR